MLLSLIAFKVITFPTDQFYPEESYYFSIGSLNEGKVQFYHNWFFWFSYIRRLEREREKIDEPREREQSRRKHVIWYESTNYYRSRNRLTRFKEKKERSRRRFFRVCIHENNLFYWKCRNGIFLFFMLLFLTYVVVYISRYVSYTSSGCVSFDFTV